MSEDKITYQLNPLIEAQKNFDLMEARLFYLGLQDINPHITENDVFYDKEFPDTVITPSELVKIFGHGQYIKEVYQTANRLIGKYISIRFEDGFGNYTIFQHIEYKEKKGLYIKFNEDMRPFLLDIYKTYRKYGFTKMDMQQIFLLGSAYAMRLLELLLQYRGTAKNGIIKREITVQDLRYKLNVPNEAYKGRIGNLKRFVLDLPINDINTNTHYFITYETVKKGRAVSGFIFYCNCNNAMADDSYTRTVESTATEKALPTPPPAAPAAPQKQEQEDKASETEQKLVTKMINYGFSLKVINQLTEKCGGVDELYRRLEYGEKRMKIDNEKKKEIKSISGYLRRAIEENWLGAKAEEEKAQAKEFETVKNSDWVAWVKENFSNEAPPTVIEIPFNLDDEFERGMVTAIKSDIKKRQLSWTSKRNLSDSGLTVARFVELYMN